MRNKLLKFYKEDVSVEALINSRIQKVYRFFIISFWSAIVFLLLSLIAYPFSVVWNIYESVAICLLFLSISIVLLIISINMYLRRARAVVRVDLKLPLKEKVGHWRTESFNNLQREKVTNFLIENKIYKKWKIEKVIDSLNKDKDSLVVPPLIAPTIFFSLMIPIINQLLTYLLAIYKEQSISIFVYSVLLTIVLTVTVNSYKKQIWSMKHDLVKNYYHRRDLIEILEDVLLSVEE